MPLTYTLRAGDKVLHLILGGRYMVKRTYALKLYGEFANIYNLDEVNPESIKNPGLIINIDSGAKNLLQRDINPSEFFLSRLDILTQCVITGCEIGSGVVPLDSFSRKWRDETGKLYQILADKADIVDRIFAGLALRLKG